MRRRGSQTTTQTTTERLSAAILSCVCLAGASALGACQKERPPEPPPAKPATAPPRPVPPPPLGARPGSDDPEPNPDAKKKNDLPAERGEWNENASYKFRFERIEACGQPTFVLGPARSPSASTSSGPLRGETSWVGALFAMHAKVPEIIFSPRDVELRRGGVVLRSRYIDPPVLEHCQPLLPTKQLQRDETLRGFALFQIPKSFRENKDGKPIVLSYQPTRWGGARRVEFPIADCFDTCPETAQTAEKPAPTRPQRIR